MKSDRTQHEDGSVGPGQPIRAGELNEALHIVGHPHVPERASEVIADVKVVRQGVAHDDGRRPLLDPPSDG